MWEWRRLTYPVISVAGIFSAFQFYDRIWWFLDSLNSRKPKYCWYKNSNRETIKCPFHFNLVDFVVQLVLMKWLDAISEISALSEVYRIWADFIVGEIGVFYCTRQDCIWYGWQYLWCLWNSQPHAPDPDWFLTTAALCADESLAYLLPKKALSYKHAFIQFWIDFQLRRVFFTHPDSRSRISKRLRSLPKLFVVLSGNALQCVAVNYDNADVPFRIVAVNSDDTGILRSIQSSRAVCCSVLKCAAMATRLSWYPWQALWTVCCSVLQCIVACCSVLQRVAVCCSVLQRVAVATRLSWYPCQERFALYYSVLLRVAVCCSSSSPLWTPMTSALRSVLQHVAAFCCVLQRLQ